MGGLGRLFGLPGYYSDTGSALGSYNMTIGLVIKTMLLMYKAFSNCWVNKKSKYVKALVGDAPRLNDKVDDGRRQRYRAPRGRWTAAEARRTAKGDGRCSGRRARTRTVRWTVRRTVRTGEEMEEERRFLATKVA